MRARAIAWILFVTLLVGGVLGTGVRAEDEAPSPCVLCADARSVPCPSCAGKGVGTLTCDICNGQRSVRCLMRGDATGDKSERLMAKISGHSGTQHKCPNSFCIDGKITWVGGKSAPCKLCGGSGLVKCADCQIAQSPCAACKGKGRIDGRCEDCAGTGKLPCLLCAKEGAACTVCYGSHSVACGLCKGGGDVVQACSTCGARGTEVCKACDGISKVRCGECDATGRTRMVYTDGTAASSTKCKNCDGRGTFACNSCRDGRATCSLCGGAKRVTEACRACEGKSTVPCRSCGVFGYRAAELEGGMLAKTGPKGAAREAAIALFERAGKSAHDGEAAALAAFRETIKPFEGLPERPSDASDPATLLEYLKRVRAALDEMEKRSRASAAQLDRAVEFRLAVDRAAKAIAKLQPPAPATPPASK